MIKIQDLRTGDIVQADYEGQRFEGTVTEINHEDGQVNIHNGDQDNWFEPSDLYAIPLDDRQLGKLGFEKVLNPDNSIKYMRGPYRLLISGPDQFNDLEIWYREDRRHVHHPIGVHEFQNFYHQMTKVDLARV